MFFFCFTFLINELCTSLSVKFATTKVITTPGKNKIHMLIKNKIHFFCTLDEIANKYANEFMNYMETGIESASMKQISTQLGRSYKKEIFTTSPNELSSINQFVACTTCRAVANVVARTFRSSEGELNGPNAEADTKKVLLILCDKLRIQTEEVCSGLFDLYWDIVHHIVMNTGGDARSMCGMLPISFCQIESKDYNWSVEVDATKGPMTAPKSSVPKKTDKDLTVVQITDIHYDPDYKVDSLADCEEPLCCRVTPASGISDEAKAGYWSDYRGCDSPLYMVEDAFDNVKKNHPKIDYIYQTGDIVPHNVWSTTKESNKEMLTEINDLISKKFPDVPVYSIVGNHEPHPTNV